MRNLKQITKQRLGGKLIIVLALLLVPTMSIAQTSCSQVSAEYLQPTQILEGKKCESNLNYGTGNLHNMVQSCFQHLNMNSIRMFGAPILTIFGVNQCICIADKIRKDYKCVEDYMKHVDDGTASEILREYSKQCILEGAMGEAARKAFIGASTDNKTKDTNPPAIEEKEELKKDTTSKKSITWDDLINK